MRDINSTSFVLAQGLTVSGDYGGQVMIGMWAVIVGTKTFLGTIKKILKYK